MAPPGRPAPVAPPRSVLSRPLVCVGSVSTARRACIAQAAQASAGAKTAGPLVQLQAKWGELDDKQRNIAVVAAYARMPEPCARPA